MTDPTKNETSEQSDQPSYVVGQKDNSPMSPATRGVNGFTATNLSANIGRRYRHKKRMKDYEVIDIVWNDDTDEWVIIIAEVLFDKRLHVIRIAVTLSSLVNKFTALSSTN